MTQMMSTVFFENKFTTEKFNCIEETMNITLKSKETGVVCSKCESYTNNC